MQKKKGLPSKIPVHFPIALARALLIQKPGARVRTRVGSETLVLKVLGWFTCLKRTEIVTVTGMSKIKS